MALDDSLVKVGLLRKDLYVLNAMCCMPPPDKSEPMMRKAAACCRPALLAQLAQFDESTPVFAMGKWAAAAMLGDKKGLMSQRGFVRRKFKLPRK